MKGVKANTVRAILMTSSQLACYDLIKCSLLKFSCFTDSIFTHFLSSLFAGAIATTVCSPVDVIKTRIMGGSPSTSNSVAVIASSIFKAEGPTAFFKGWIPSFTRLGPQTVLTFVILEQLRSYYDQLPFRNTLSNSKKVIPEVTM
ncbi:hypothetical protein DSO57_1010156 [Entomophthora muscae]|uniref:Uncharacterized protein n=1 Tax=Entomophthora muscae TaxID=34485 RepID=A0ACC2UGN5_9FUNG|nr:hypothetical protein DSO57_1010156 [Entomophthora muscae]